MRVKTNRMIFPNYLNLKGLPGGSMVKNLPANAGDIRDAGLIPGGRHGNSLQYSCLENPKDRGAWWVTVHGVTKHHLLRLTE